MTIHYRDLNTGSVRTLAVQEVDRDIQAGTIYQSPRLTPEGSRQWPSLLRDALASHDDGWLAAALRARGLLASHEPRRTPSGGTTMAKVPVTAADTLAEGEFNRFYARGLCADVLASGGTHVMVYRGKDVANPRVESEAMITRRPWGKDITRDAITLLAREAPYDPVVSWLDGLRWDGTARIAGFSRRYLGVDGEDAYWRTWLVGLVARQYHPGAKADHMLVLRGPQGWGKDRFFSALLPDRDWYLESGVDPTGKGRAEPGVLIQGRVIVNFPELASLSRAEVEDVKKFLTLTTDEYRAPYDRYPTTARRRCVFVGSTNSEQPLRDLSGNRRFLFIDTPRTGVYAEEALVRDRDQVFAEAVHLYRSGVRPYLTEDEMAALEARNAALVDVDPVLLRVVDWARETGQEFTASAALTGIGVPLTEQARYHQRLAIYLGKPGMGFERRTLKGRTLWRSTVRVAEPEATIAEMDGVIPFPGREQSA